MPALRGVLYASAAERLANHDLALAALRAQQGAVDRDPADPQWWWLRGQLAESFGTPGQAARDYRRALARNPWSAEAMTGMMRLAYRRGDTAGVERWRTRLCQIGPTVCVRRSALSRLEVKPAIR
jgi:Flp pilus assembly protein TadD